MTLKLLLRINLLVLVLLPPLLVKEYGPRNHYLSNDYTYYDEQYMLTYSCQTYDKEAIARVERMYGYLPKKSIPLMVTACHLELNTAPLLGLDDHLKFQMLIVMLPHMATIYRIKLCQLVESLSHFGAFPKEGQLELAISAFGYDKNT